MSCWYRIENAIRNCADSCRSALIASVVKISEIRNLSLSEDLTYNMVSLQFCAVVENNVVIIAASIPKLRPLYHRHVPRYFDRSLGDQFDSDEAPNASPNARDRADGIQIKGLDMDYTERDVDVRRVDVEDASRNRSALSLASDDTRNTNNEQRSTMHRFWRHSEISITI